MEFLHAPADVDPDGYEAHERAKFILDSLTTKKAVSTDFIRYGLADDGGYILANDLSASDGLISFGVGNEVSFEKALEHVVKSTHMYDYSVNGLPQEVSNASFFKEKISAVDTTVETALSRMPGAADYILKADIEGYEWELFSTIDSAVLETFRQISVEMHWFSKILNNDWYYRVHAALQKILRTHTPVVKNPNNYRPPKVIGNCFMPEVIEVTFLRNSSYDLQDYEGHAVNQLTNKNSPWAPQILLFER